MFCTLPDETARLCLYSARHADSDFRIGDTVILVISRTDHERSLIYDRISAKWWWKLQEKRLLPCVGK